jgi:hypothetical protein
VDLHSPLSPARLFLCVEIVDPMTVKLRPTGLASPGFQDRAHWTVYSGEWQIGRICEDRNGTEDLRWQWSLYGPIAGPREIRRSGRSPTFAKAKEQFAENWRKLVAWAGLKELE